MPHRKALALRNMSQELQTIFQAVIRIVECIENSPLRGRSFATLRDDMGAGHTTLLYYCETRWLSRAKVFSRVFELEEDTTIFLRDSNNNDDANLFYHEDFIQKLAYLGEGFKKLSRPNFYKSMHGAQTNTLAWNGKVNLFMKKIELWKRNMEHNIFYVLYF
jgi:hypothetical protein